MSALPPGPGGPPMGPPPMGPPSAGPPPGSDMGPSPEEVDQLIEMLQTLPPNIKQQVISALNSTMDEGPSEPEGSPIEEPGPDAMREAASARAGL